jgi:hypothetical protein
VSAITRSASMVRLRTERTGSTWVLGGKGFAHLSSPAGRMHVLAFRIKRTKKVVLFQNVLRKTIGNYSFVGEGTSH